MNKEDKELVKEIKERYFNILDTNSIKECYSDIGKLLKLVDKEDKIICSAIALLIRSGGYDKSTPADIFSFLEDMANKIDWEEEDDKN